MDPYIPKTIEKKDAFKYAFKQQILPAWKPVITMKNTFLLFFVNGIAFIIIGFVLLSFSQQIVEVKNTYSNGCSDGSTCTVDIVFSQDMPAPTFFYIELTNFYQNHRLYLKSKSMEQLAGLNPSNSVVSTSCSSVVTNLEMGNIFMSGLSGKTALDGTTILKDNDTADPCGLIAKSFFNDVFTVLSGPSVFTITGLTKRMKGTKLIEVYQLDEGGGYAQFQKTLGKDQHYDLKGHLQDLDIKQFQNQQFWRQNVYLGTKGIVFSNATVFGGKNFTLSYLYIAFGFLSLAISIAFWIKSTFYPEKMPELKFD